MAELEIHHAHGEHNDHDTAGKNVGILASVLAVLLAVVTIASHRTHTAAIILKSTANDDWAYYQSSSIKLHEVELGENMMDVLEAKGDKVGKVRASYADQRKKYQSQKDEQMEKAKKADEEAESAEQRALRYDFGEGLLEIGLVLSSLYFIARKMMFPVMGVIAGIIGAGIAITGFLK